MTTIEQPPARFWKGLWFGFAVGLVLGAIAGFCLIVTLIALTSYPQ